MFPLKRSEKWRERRRMKDEKRASGRKLSKWKYNVTADERYRHEHDLETESVLYTTKWLDDLSGLWPSFFFQTFHSQIVLMGLLSAPAALICIQPHWLGPPTKFPLPRTEWKKVLYPLLQPWSVRFSQKSVDKDHTPPRLSRSFLSLSSEKRGAPLTLKLHYRIITSFRYLFILS